MVGWYPALMSQRAKARANIPQFPDTVLELPPTLQIASFTNAATDALFPMAL
jgi:hypothetical protein